MPLDVTQHTLHPPPSQVAAELSSGRRHVLPCPWTRHSIRFTPLPHRLLLSCPVVGTTCCTLLRSDPSATTATATDTAAAPTGTAAGAGAAAGGGGRFAGGRFSLLVLDECSQMVEPLSLSAITRSGAAFLVAAGDPCQVRAAANPFRAKGWRQIQETWGVRGKRSTTWSAS